MSVYQSTLGYRSKARQAHLKCYFSFPDFAARVRENYLHWF